MSRRVSSGVSGRLSGGLSRRIDDLTECIVIVWLTSDFCETGVCLLSGKQNPSICFSLLDVCLAEPIGFIQNHLRDIERFTFRRLLTFFGVL